MASPPDLILHAIRLWPGDEYLQSEWLRAIAVVRATKRGWILDPILQRTSARMRVLKAAS
jgi:hypothetical protein